MSRLILGVSKGRFAPEKYAQVKKLIEESASPLAPALRGRQY
jgi:hypothetical protein